MPIAKVSFSISVVWAVSVISVQGPFQKGHGFPISTHLYMFKNIKPADWYDDKVTWMYTKKKHKEMTNTELTVG